TTHYMEEAETLCDDIAIMDAGRIIARGAPDELIRTNCRRATLVFPEDQLPGRSNAVSGSLHRRDGRIEIKTENVNLVVAQLLAEGVDMRAVSIRTPSLEDVFLQLTGRRLRE
ncbi:MAG TPA: ABC transporter ATP-binding protein, partial [Desulfosarcina sp.]|nr:ABC transporter ATP-binding protein [Desulfosarcina sp.]